MQRQLQHPVKPEQIKINNGLESLSLTHMQATQLADLGLIVRYVKQPVPGIVDYYMRAGVTREMCRKALGLEHFSGRYQG